MYLYLNHKLLFKTLINNINLIQVKIIVKNE